MTRNTANDELEAVEDWLDHLDPATDPARDGRNMRRISAALESVRLAEQDLVEAVQQARQAGDTWAMIGTALGTSRQAAYQRFGNGGNVVEIRRKATPTKAAASKAPAKKAATRRTQSGKTAAARKTATKTAGKITGEKSRRQFTPAAKRTRGK